MSKLENLESIRKSKNLTRRELALLSGVKHETIVALELGKTNADNVKLSTILKLAKALKVKVVDLVDKDLQRYFR